MIQHDFYTLNVSIERLDTRSCGMRYEICFHWLVYSLYANLGVPKTTFVILKYTSLVCTIVDVMFS